MSATGLPPPPAGRQILRLMWCTVAGFTGFAVLLSVLPVWAVRGGATTGVAGSVTTVTLAATVATQFAVPAVVARRGTGSALAAGLLLLGAPAPLYALSADLPWLLALSAVRGVGFGLLTVVGSLLVALLAAPGTYGRTAGRYGLAIALPNLVAVPGGLLLAQNVSFPVVLGLAVVPVVAAPAAMGFGTLGRQEPSTPRQGTRSTTRPTTRPTTRTAARAAAGPAAVLLVVTLAGGGVLTFVPIALPDDGLLAPAVLLAVGATGAVGRWLVGSLADRLGAGLLLLPSLVVGAAGVLLVAAGLATAATPQAVLLLAGGLAVGAGYGAVQNLTLVVAFERAGPGGSATASAVWNAAFDTGTGVGAFGVGALAAAGTGLPGAFVACALLVLAAAPLSLRLSRQPGS